MALRVTPSDREHDWLLPVTFEDVPVESQPEVVVVERAPKVAYAAAALALIDLVLVLVR